jgi:hypothetical protein
VFTRYDDNLAGHIYLRTLQDISEALFYKLVTDYPEEMLLIVCGPNATVEVSRNQTVTPLPVPNN